MATSIPPHNVAEICDALQHLIKTPNARTETLLGYMPGPDFPTGGVLIEPREQVIEAYRTGRGSFRVRAKWVKESLPRGQYRIVVTEIPYQVPKAKLVEKIAELINGKKLPMLEDVRDESAEDLRLVLEPKTGNVPAELLMEQLFRLTDLESRFPLNLNVLDADQVPRVMDLRETLQAWLDHRQVVLQRRSRHRLAEIERRLEILNGYLIAYLNIDDVIAIIRAEDEPKTVLMSRFKLSDLQAESILNMRLRALRRLEEIEIKKEHKSLTQERKDLKALLADDKKQWQSIAAEIQELRRNFGARTDNGRRRTEIADAPPPVDVPIDAFIEKEPVTVVCSEKGWIRAARSHLDPGGIADLKYKEGDREKFWLYALSTDRLLVFGTNGRFYTIGIDRLPSARGHGEPIRLMIDLGNEQDIVDLLVFKGGRKFLVAGHEGRGFIVPEDEVVAQTRGGKQVLNLGDGEEAVACRVVPEGADHVASIGENRKLLVFPIGDLPEMTRGRGVILQKHKDGGLSDAVAFVLADGLQWQSRLKTKAELKEWIGERAQAGRLPPPGSPRANKF
jgi:topoisomerase-4 subunit A